MITRAPLSLNLGGRTYDFHPLTFEDFEWLELKLRAKYIESVRLSGADAAAMQDAIAHAQTIDLFENISDLFRPTMIIWVLQRILRRNDPPVGIEEIEQLLRDPELRDQFMPHISVLFGVPAKNDAAPTPVATPAAAPGTLNRVQKRPTTKR